MFRQCLVSRNSVNKVVWLPMEFAIKDKFIKIGNVNGWKVNSVYKQIVDESFFQRQREGRKTLKSIGE